MSTQIETKTHWKKLHNPNYFGAYCLLEGQEIIVTIKSVGLETVIGQGGRKEECTVAHFNEDVKPLILNVVNQKSIQKAHGTPYIEEWVGKKITIFHTNENIKGENMEVVRVRQKAPTSKKEDFTPNHKGWIKAVSQVAEGNLTVDTIRKHYTLSNDNESKLQNEVMKLVNV